MALFDRVKTSCGVIRPDESWFQFLQRSDTPQVVEMRTRLERWLEEIPQPQRQQLRDRIRLPNNEAHDSAVFELVVHAFLIQRNCKVLEYEAAIGGRNPDFLIETPCGDRVFVEASAINEMGAAERRQSGFEWRVVTAFNKVQRIPYHPHLTFKKEFTSTPRLAPLQKAFHMWLSDPDRAPVLELSEAGGTLPVRIFCETSPGYSGPTISATLPSESGAIISPQNDIRRKIKRKSDQLSACDAPALLALSLPVFHRTSHAMSEAFFGDEVIYVDVQTAEITRVARKGNAALLHKGSPNNKNISGVLSFPSSRFSDIDDLRVEFWENPWARHPIDIAPLNIPRWLANHSSGRMELHEVEQTQPVDVANPPSVQP